MKRRPGTRYLTEFMIFSQIYPVDMILNSISGRIPDFWPNIRSDIMPDIWPKMRLKQEGRPNINFYSSPDPDVLPNIRPNLIPEIWPNMRPDEKISSFGYPVVRILNLLSGLIPNIWPDIRSVTRYDTENKNTRYPVDRIFNLISPDTRSIPTYLHAPRGCMGLAFKYKTLDGLFRRKEIILKH